MKSVKICHVGAVGGVAIVVLCVTGKVGPGGGVKTSRLIVSCILFPRFIELRYLLYIFGIGRPSWQAPEGAAVCVG